MRTGRALAVILPALLPWCAAAARAEGETVTFPVGDETVRAYLAKPPNSRNAPGLVVIHEWWGLNEQIMGIADRLERLGYIAIAPDLYRGKLAADPGLAHEMMRGLSESRAVSIVKGAIDHLRRLDRANDRPVGTIGFSMGGRLSQATALQGADVQATVIFYGSVETTADAVAPIKAPVLGIFGSKDRGIPVEDVKKFEAVLKETGKDATIIVYEGLGHAFMNDARADYEPEMAKDAWIRMRDWLAVKLRPALPSRQQRRGAPAQAPAPTPGLAPSGP